MAAKVLLYTVLIWIPGILAGTSTFALFLTIFTNMLQNPPPLPTNLNDVKACSGFIVNTNPSDYSDAFRYLLGNR